MVVLLLSHAFLSVVAIRCYSDMGIPAFWASPSHITLTIWVRVRVTGDVYITRVLGMGMAKTWGCPYQCDIGTLEI